MLRFTKVYPYCDVAKVCVYTKTGCVCVKGDRVCVDGDRVCVGGEGVWCMENSACVHGEGVKKSWRRCVCVRRMCVEKVCGVWRTVFVFVEKE